ncbi:Protein DGCR6 [Aphelenchoides bicaudatus]|nr:Protein DGCR6 [Aphelenchoides bicaudatus]
MPDNLRETITDRLNEFYAICSESTKGVLAENVKTNLIDSLLDGSVYSVVNSLTHLQELKETELLNQRYRRVRELGVDSEDVQKVQAIDRNIMEQIDELVREQQSNLCCVGLPFFKVTKDREDIKIQIEIIRFIQSLSDLFSEA